MLQFTIVGRHIEITPTIKSHAKEKAEKLPRYFDGINRVEVLIDGSTKGRVEAEVIARGEHKNVFVVRQQGVDVLACIDLAVHKLEKQLQKKKGRQRNRKHRGGRQKRS